MATHRPQDPGFAPAFEFQVAIGVLEASEILTARRRPITPETLARQLRIRPFPVRPTVAQIERGLAQVQCWRDHILTRDLLLHRGQLVGLDARLRAQRRQLDEDQFYLDKMLRETDALLQNTLTTPDGAESVPAHSGVSEARPLQ